MRTRTLERALAVIEALVASEGPLGVSELTRVLRLDKATVFRILAAWSRRGYVRQDPQTRRYDLDAGLLTLSARVLSRMDLPQRARPYLAALVTRTGQSAHLAVLAPENPLWTVYVGQEKGPSRVQVDIGIGHVAPAHCTAVGKALLAGLPPDRLRAVLADARLTKFTPKTRVTLPSLERHLAVVRRQGYAVDDEEFHRNIRCIAAPVRGRGGEVVASIGISGIAADIPSGRIPPLARVVVETAARLSEELGHPAGRTGGRRHLTADRWRTGSGRGAGRRRPVGGRR
ncbi:MAG: IclR family transcriptional regulator [Armatimonadota bacterium]|nr:IclR family transcriptional regulator [Armatimonadota bacterium]MDR7448288.1 IclR family transcriptional regulator [Armatimonadota bacterium]MDR7458318.1 IclR family transcriptional regulator [Armatimonadota bacterium]MDR7478379.1 IclR family transcriptional regulator [Armatimonadota bacterium]MDR7487313.1 IclR family transcriptional regulator [Armatimonadota bacterium]